MGKLPHLYKKFLGVVRANDIRKADEFDSKDLTSVANRKFRLSKADIKTILKELGSKGITQDLGQNKYRLLKE
jgi:hypothetical protein